MTSFAAFCLAPVPATIRRASSASAAQCTTPPAAVQSLLKLLQIEIQMLHRVPANRARRRRAAPASPSSPPPRAPASPGSRPSHGAHSSAAAHRPAAAAPPSETTAPSPDLSSTRTAHASRTLSDTLCVASPESPPGAPSSRPSAAGAARLDVHQAGIVARRANLRPRVPARPASSPPASPPTHPPFFTANVPPNPQHRSRFGSSTSSIPRTFRSSRTGPSPKLQLRSPWQLA